MKKRLFLVIILVILNGFLSGCGPDQYTKERSLWYLHRQVNNILMRPAWTPPREVDRVIARLKQIVNEDPNTEIALWQEFHIGHLYRARGKFDEAREQYNEILNKYKENIDIVAEAILHIGYAYEIQDNVELARGQYNRVINDYPQSKFSESAVTRLKVLDKTIQ